MNLHQALLKVKSGERTTGICESAFLVLYAGGSSRFEIYSEISELAKDWYEFSGDPAFPVPCKTSSAIQAYYALPHWEGEYGAARLRLLDYLIEVTSESR